MVFLEWTVVMVSVVNLVSQAFQDFLVRREMPGTVDW
jgi:hypothetical protein